MAKFNKSPQYWSDRMDEIMAYVDKTDIDFFDELQDIYTEGRQNVQKEIYAFYAQYATDNQITLHEAKQRLMREDLSDYRSNAEKYLKQAEKDPELLKRLNEQYKAGKVTRLEALHLDLEWHLGLMSQTLHKSFDSYLKEVAKYAYRKIIGGNSKSTLNKAALEQIVKTPFKGKNYSSSIWGNTDDLAKDLKKVLTQGFIRGSGPADMARELRKKYNVAKSRAEAIVRTDGTNVVNNATLKRYKEFGLTKYQFQAHIDSRTTEICKGQNGKVYNIEDYMPGLNAPPMHVNCRSTIVPDDSELGIEDDPEEVEELSNLDVKELYDKSQGNRKAFAETLLKENGIDVPVEIKPIKAFGYNQFENFGKGQTANISSFVLNKNDDRSSHYQTKTVLHEAYHSRMQGLEVPISQSGKFTIKEWTAIEETMTETSAHYQMSFIDKAKLMPSYANYLSVNLPRLQKIEGFEEATDFLDFGKIAMKYRFDDKYKTADWRDLNEKINAVEFDFSKYVRDNYVEELKKNKTTILDMIYANSTNFKQHDEYIQKDYDNFIEKVASGNSYFSKNEEMIGKQSVTALYRLVGVKKWK